MKRVVTRREVLKRAAYVAPLIVTVAVMPALASSGSPLVPAPHHHNKWHPW